MTLNKSFPQILKRVYLSPPQVLVMGFALVIITGALILTLPGFTVPGKDTDFLTALFTATSAVCVTGLVVVDTGTHWTVPGQILIMLLIQVGGLGFMTMAMIFYIILGKRIGLRKRLIIQESLNQMKVAGVVRLVKAIFLFTLLTELTAAVILGLWWSRSLGEARGMYFGLFHAVSSFNNAGFDLFGDFRSLTGYVEDPVVNLVVTSLIVIGGLGFSVVYDLWRNRSGKKGLSVHTRLVLLISFILLFIGTVVFMGLEWNNTLKGLSPLGKVLGSYFQSVTPRTAGLNTVDIAALRPGTLFFMAALMFIGASPGSTGGGIKTTTFGLLLLASVSVSLGREDIEAYKKRIPFSQVNKALTILILSIFWVILVIMILSVTEGGDFLTLLFETVSAFGTVGLSKSFTPHLSQIGRVIIIMTMFIGRLGPMTVAFALAYRMSVSKVRYPEEKIIVG